jgi:hypothetical protein
MSTAVVVPGWLLALDPAEAESSCRWSARACLAEATRYRCSGYSTVEWYAAARVWLRLADALRGGGDRGCDLPFKPSPFQGEHLTGGSGVAAT